jgi:two-component system, NarL family, invasion response regulator UvrY
VTTNPATMKPKRPKIKVAYAEDHIAMRDAMVDYLEKGEEIQVILLGDNGQMLLENMILADELPDVCLIDINMPVMNGFSLLIEIRKRWPELPCLVLTSFVEESYIINMVKARANGYILKSFTGKELIDAVKCVYTNGHFFNEIMNEQAIANILIENKKSPILNEREIQLLQLVCSDLSYADIGVKWNTTYKTVEGIKDRLCTKLHITSRIGLVLAAIRMGYYTIESQQYAQSNNSENKTKFNINSKKQF